AAHMNEAAPICPIEHAGFSADHFFNAGQHGSLEGAQRVADKKEDEGGTCNCSARDGPPGEAELRAIAIDQHGRAENKGDKSAEACHAECGRENLYTHKHEAKHDESDACIVERKLVQRIEPEQQADRAENAGANAAGI